jgi:hypothetical protein
MGNATKFEAEDVKRPLGDLGTDGNVILICVLKNKL